MSKKAKGIMLMVLAYAGVGVIVWALQGHASSDFLQSLALWPIDVLKALYGVVA